MIAEAVKHMLAAGMPHDAIVAAIADMEAAAPQPETRSKGALRTARWRERQASQNVTERRAVTEVTETSHTPFLDKESFPQTPFKEINPIPVCETRARGARLSADWEPKRPYPPTVAALVAKWPPGREQRELDAFRDYWTSRSRDATKLDWDKTWHNRIREQHDRVVRVNGHERANGKSASGYGRTIDAALDWIAESEYP